MYAEELARRRFWQFCLYYDREFFHQRAFLREVAEAFQAIQDKAVLKVAISMPPRAGKSYVTSLFCAWWLGRNPTQCVMRNTVSATLYNKFSYDVRAIIRSPTFRDVFVEVQLSPDKQNVDGWSLVTSKQGAYFGGGVGTNIIGFGANLAITDDLYSGFADALSNTVNDATHTWKQGSHNSRMEKDCPEIFIGTRWSQRDVIGSAILSGQIDIVIKIAALNERRESFCDAVKSTEEYIQLEQNTEEMIWRAEYQQEPIEAFGLLFPTDQLHFYDPKSLPKGDHHFMPIDPANKGGDYFASAHCVLAGRAIYVPHVFCNREGSDQSNILHEQYIRGAKIEAVEYEGVLQWQNTAAALRDKLTDIDISFRITKPTQNKQTRILVQAPFIKNHFYFREDYKNFPEYRTFINILTAYLRDQSGNNKAPNDDPPDVLAAAANYFKRNFGHLW